MASVNQKYEKYKAKYLQSKIQLGGYDEESQMDEQNSNLQDITTELFSHLIMIKMLHFQTTRYGSHKALDKYYNKFNKNLDMILEVLQGEKGKITIKDSSLIIKSDLANDSNIIQKLDTFKKEVLINMINTNYGSNLGLISIRDELVADIDQLKYLLTFQ